MLYSPALNAQCCPVDTSTKAANVKKANTRLDTSICTENVTEQFQTWKQNRSKNVMFKSALNDMHRVEIALFFTASRNAHMTLHLSAGEQLSKLFFFMDRSKYKRLYPRYISDMHEPRTTYHDTWNELVGESNANDTGQNMYEDYVTEGINGNI